MRSISAATNKGVDQLIKHVYENLKQIPVPEIVVDNLEQDENEKKDEKLFDISVEGNVYTVKGDYVYNLVNSTNFDDVDSFSYFQRSLRKSGIIDALEKLGIQEGDTVVMDDVEFDYEK